jgi:hypothetical protein
MEVGQQYFEHEHLSIAIKDCRLINKFSPDCTHQRSLKNLPSLGSADDITASGTATLFSISPSPSIIDIILEKLTKIWLLAQQSEAACVPPHGVLPLTEIY